MKTTPQFILVLFILINLLIFTGVIPEKITRAEEGTIIYIDVNLTYGCIGNYSIMNRDDSGTDGDAYTSIQEAVNVAEPGDTLLIRAGTYLVSALIQIQESGTAAQPITLKNYPGETPELRSDTDISDPSSYTGYLIRFTNSASYWVIEGLHLTNFVDGSITTHDVFSYMNLTFRNLTIADPNYDIPVCGSAPCYNAGYGKRNGLYITKTTNVHIDRVVSEASIMIYQESDNALIENSSVNETTEDGFYVDSSSSATIKNCTACNNTDSGYDITGPTTIIDSVAYSNLVGFKFWSGPHYARGITSINNLEYGVLISVRSPAFHQDIAGELHLSQSTVVRNKLNLYVGTSHTTYGSTMFIQNVISAYPDNRYVGGTHRTLFSPSSSPACIITDEGNNLLYRESDPVVRLLGTDYTSDQINDDDVPGLDASMFCAIPDFISIDSYPELFENVQLYDLHISEHSPAVDQGAVILDYHCPTADDDPEDPMDSCADCRHWYGTAPDIGAYEYSQTNIQDDDPEHNTLPIFSTPQPTNASTVPQTTSKLSILINDTENDSFNWTIETSPAIGNASGTNEHNGTKNCTLITSLSYSTTYHWYVNVTDTRSGNSTNHCYWFTTENKPDENSGGDPPSSGSGDVPPTEKNKPPVADTGGPYTGYVNQSITIDASNSTDPDTNTLSYRWDFTNDSI